MGKTAQLKFQDTHSNYDYLPQFLTTNKILFIHFSQLEVPAETYLYNLLVSSRASLYFKVSGELRDSMRWLCAPQRTSMQPSFFAESRPTSGT